MVDETEEKLGQRAPSDGTSQDAIVLEVMRALRAYALSNAKAGLYQKRPS